MEYVSRNTLHSYSGVTGEDEEDAQGSIWWDRAGACGEGWWMGGVEQGQEWAVLGLGEAEDGGKGVGGVGGPWRVIEASWGQI